MFTYENTVLGYHKIKVSVKAHTLNLQRDWLKFELKTAKLGEDATFRIPGSAIYMCRCALKNEVYNNSCHSYLMRCK